jgi:hypothetical protein
LHDFLDIGSAKADRAAWQRPVPLAMRRRQVASDALRALTAK